MAIPPTRGPQAPPALPLDIDDFLLPPAHAEAVAFFRWPVVPAIVANVAPLLPAANIFGIIANVAIIADVANVVLQNQEHTTPTDVHNAEARTIELPPRNLFSQGSDHPRRPF